MTLMMTMNVCTGKVVIVVSFFVATSFWDLAIHWSEFKFVRPGEAEEVIIEEHGFVYEPVEPDHDETPSAQPRLRTGPHTPFGHPEGGAEPT